MDVFFIGNSLTYYNGMPEMLQKMLADGGDWVNIEQSTFPGMSLSAHLDNIIVDQTEGGVSTRKKLPGEVTETEKKIAEKQWDMVVLQEGTIQLLIPEARAFLVNPAIEKMKTLVDNPDCKILLFRTWPSRADYPRQYCYPSAIIEASIAKEKSCSTNIQDLEHEMELINKAYESLAASSSIQLTDNGNRFYQILKYHPDISLYEDESHPSKTGAYLNACIFYQTITGKKATSITYDAELPKATAAFLRKMAE